jgi:hypothetical protein
MEQGLDGLGRTVHEIELGSRGRCKAGLAKRALGDVTNITSKRM